MTQLCKIISVPSEDLDQPELLSSLIKLHCQHAIATQLVFVKTG